MIRPGIRSLFHLALRRRDVAREVDTELQTHVALRTEQLIAAGWHPGDARDEAIRRLGSVDHARRLLRSAAMRREHRMQLRERLSDLWTDVRQSIRSLAREPGVTLFAIVALALGVGANATAFGILDRLLLRPPEHIRDPERVRRVQITSQREGNAATRSGSFGYVAYDLIRRNAKTISGAAAYSISEGFTTIGRGVASRRVNGGYATASLFPLLGVQPALGRFFDEREDDVVAPQDVAVIGYGLWQSEFAGTRDVVGRTILINNKVHTIVGVAPKGFTGPGLVRVDVWRPESANSHSSNWTQTWNARWLAMVVRLRDGVTPAQADAEITSLYLGVRARVLAPTVRLSLATRPLNTQLNGTVAPEGLISKWLMGVALIVLVIAVANVINLLLARTLRRRREIAVRLTLGAGRPRLMRLLMTEALVIAGSAAVAGAIAAFVLGKFARGLLIPSVEWTSGIADVRVGLMAGAIALGAGLIVGLVPAMQSITLDLTRALRTQNREGGGRSQRTRATLTVVQAALSVALLIGAGLFVRSLRNVNAIDFGVDAARVLSFDIQRDGNDTLPWAERDAATYPALLEKVRARADVERASIAVGLAFGALFGENIRVPGLDSIPGLKGGGPFVSAVSSDFFATVGTPIVKGRAFESADRAGSAPVAIVNETMAATLWPGEDAIGKCFYIGRSSDCSRIVGIARDSRRGGLREDKAMAYYVPFGQNTSIAGATLVVRPRGDVRAMVAELRKELFSMDPGIAFVTVTAMQSRIDERARPWRLGATMFLGMGAIALIVAAIGLYSLISYFVANRRHEIGVRMALGAGTASIVRLVVGNGLFLASVGVTGGCAIAFAAARFMEPLLFDTSPKDPQIFVTMSAVLLMVAALATVLPAVRARKVAPAEAMRAD